MRIFAFLLLGYANLSLALGIGEITLKSHLGEPLAASINVTDVEKSPDASCFSVKDNSEIPAFKKATTLLKQNSNGYQLNISTHDVITEPIVNLQVLFHCEPNLNREYILLLDPASLVSPEIADNANHQTVTDYQTNDSNSKNLSKNSKSIVPSDKTADSESSVDEGYLAPKPTTTKKKKFKKKINSESEIDEKLAEAYTGKERPFSKKAVAQTENNKTSDNKTNSNRNEVHGVGSKPYLTISGGNASSSEHGTLPNLALRLETQIDFARVEATAPLSATDALDEITVMANRLAHLEKQIVSLQNKNSQLLGEAEKAKEQAKNASLLSEQQLHWLRNLLIGLCILVLLAGGEWLRRKAIRKRLDREEAIWFDAKENTPPHDESSIFSITEFDSADDSLLDDASFGGSTSSSPNTDSLTLTENASDDHENILENADVFIEHGRPALAIQLLQNHLSDFPSESPKIWLRLLSLIAAEGSEPEYDQAVSECKHFFNIKMPTFAEANVQDSSSIEDFPHIIARLEGVWGSQYAVGFLNDLIYNQQSQPREGFGRGTFEELFFLKQVAEILSANVSKEQTSFYKSTTVKPKLENLAFNEVAFSDTKIADDAKSQSRAEEKGKGDSNASSITFGSSLENSAFQNVPSYEVDMLMDFDDAPNTKNSASQDELLQDEALKDNLSNKKELLNNELIPTLDTSEKTADLEVARKILQADNIQFSAPEFPTLAENENIFDISEPDTSALNADEDEDTNKPVQKSNVIEWDLPKKD